MCRFVLYLGPPISMASLITEPSHSLINQSVRSRERREPQNGDGFGVAWYQPEVSPEPALFRSVTPAWSNLNLGHLARVTRSPCILAHVRAASPGSPVIETNCHPFVHRNVAFMHNGEVAGFARLRRTLIAGLSEEAYGAIEGTTDSEHIFGVFLDCLAAAAGSGVEALVAAVTATVRRMVALARGLEDGADHYMNLAASDGRTAVVTRFTTAAPEQAASLYLHTGRRYVCEGGVCRMVAPEEGQGTAIVSSEPLSSDPGWSKVPVNHVVMIHHDRRTETRPIEAGAAAG